MYKMMTFNHDMTLADSREFNSLSIAESFAVFRNFGQILMIIDTKTGKCVHYAK